MSVYSVLFFKIDVSSQSCSRFLHHPFPFPIIDLLTNPNHLTGPFSHSLYFVDSTNMMKINIFLCPSYFLQTGNWMKAFDQNQVQFLWSFWEIVCSSSVKLNVEFPYGPVFPFLFIYSRELKTKST